MDRFNIKIKLGRRKPGYLTEWLSGIVASSSRKGATGIVVWKEPGECVDEALVILRLQDWQSLHGE